MRLPDGSNVQSNIDGTHIIATPAGMNTSTQALGTSTQGVGTSTQGMGTSTQAMGTPTQEMGTSAQRMGTSIQGMGTSNQRMGSSNQGIGVSSSQGIGVYSTQGISTSVQTVNTNGMQNSSGKESPAYAVVKKKPVSAQTSNGFSSRNYQKTTVVTQTQTTSQSRMSPPKTAAVPPPPAPPPPPVPPPVSPKPQSFIVSKEANRKFVFFNFIPLIFAGSNIFSDVIQEICKRIRTQFLPTNSNNHPQKLTSCKFYYFLPAKLPV